MRPSRPRRSSVGIVFAVAQRGEASISQVARHLVDDITSIGREEFGLRPPPFTAPPPDHRAAPACQLILLAFAHVSRLTCAVNDGELERTTRKTANGNHTCNHGAART
jgi:hypothetical protein